jgi:hypothetical protein
MNIVRVKKSKTNAGIAGWYVTDSDCDPSEWTWRNCGNGPELVNPDGTGPFANEAAAEAWLRRDAEEIAVEKALNGDA